MKTVKILLSAVLVLTFLLPMSVFPNELEDNFVDEVGEIDCPYGSPNVDASIDVAEGWSEAQYIDKTNTDGCWGGEEVVITGNIYRAWDENNLYIAADINIPEFTICTGLDDIDGSETGNKPGWNGDVFVYSVDPLQALLNSGFMKDAAPWYCFGLFEGGVVRTYRTHLNDGEITEQVTAKGVQTETGWRFEAALPWALICADTEEFSFGDAPLTPEIVAKAGSKISGSMIYYDRVFDPEQNGMITGSRYVTIAKTLPDGTPGVQCSGWILDAHGMHFMLSGGPAVDDGNDDAGAAGGTGGSGSGETGGNTNNGNNTNTENNTNNGNNTNTNTNTNTKPDTNTNTNTNSGTGNKKPTTGASTGGNAAQTSDMSTAVLIPTVLAVVCAVVVISVVLTKKRV